MHGDDDVRPSDNSLILAGRTPQYGIGLDLLILLLAISILVAIGAKLYPRVAV